MAACRGATCTPVLPHFWTPVTPVRLKLHAVKSPGMGHRLDELLDQVLDISCYNVLDAKPELSGSMATRLLKSPELKRFFARWGTVAGGYDDLFEGKLNTNNVVASLWEEYSNCAVFLREAYSKGLEPFDQATLDDLDVSMRKQRVWIGVVAPSNDCLKSIWQAWVHAYYFHQMWYVHKYRGIGGLSQEAIEDAHKEVNRDVNVFSAAGTRVAKAADWLRIIGGYNFDLLTLWENERLRNGVHIDKYRCTCRAGQQKRCSACVQRDPVKLLQLGF